MKKGILLLLCIFVCAVLTGCETFKGFAKDVQNTGDNIWEAITRKK